MATSQAAGWKRQEREVAQALGGHRLPNTGQSQADVLAEGWAVQVKTRKALPDWLWQAVEQARRDAMPGELPAVVLSEVSQGKKARRLVVLEWATFITMVGGSCDG